MSDPTRVEHLHGILAQFQEHVNLSDAIVHRATEYTHIGITNLDALHLACAEQAQAVFLTTDDGIINIINRANFIRNIIITNPVTWLEKEYNTL